MVKGGAIHRCPNCHRHFPNTYMREKHYARYLNNLPGCFEWLCVAPVEIEPGRFVYAAEKEIEVSGWDNDYEDNETTNVAKQYEVGFQMEVTDFPQLATQQQQSQQPKSGKKAWVAKGSTSSNGTSSGREVSEKKDEAEVQVTQPQQFQHQKLEKKQKSSTNIGECSKTAGERKGKEPLNKANTVAAASTDESEEVFWQPRVTNSGIKIHEVSNEIPTPALGGAPENLARQTGAVAAVKCCKHVHEHLTELRKEEELPVDKQSDRAVEIADQTHFSLSSIGKRVSSYVENAIRGVVFYCSSYADFVRKTAEYSTTFMIRKNLPNEHYYKLKEAMEEGVGYEPYEGTFHCPDCDLCSTSLVQLKLLMSGPVHLSCVKRKMTKRVSHTKHDKDTSKTRVATQKSDTAILSVDRDKDTITFGSFLVDLTKHLPRANKEEAVDDSVLVGPQVVFTGALEIGESSTGFRPTYKKHKRLRSNKRSRSVDVVWRKANTPWPEGDKVVTSADLPFPPKAKQVPYTFVDLLQDERDVIRVEEVPDTKTKWQFWKKKKACVKPKMQTHCVNDLIRQTLNICVETGIPLQYIDGRRLITKERKRTKLRIPLVHAFDPDAALEDDIKDDTLRIFLESEYVVNQLNQKADHLIHTGLIKPGWSGALIVRDEVLDDENVEWNAHGLCVVKGRGTNGKILNALNRHKDEEVLEFYSENSFVQEMSRRFNDGIRLDHEPTVDDLGVVTMCNFFRAFHGKKHLCCSKCIDNNKQLPLGRPTGEAWIEAEARLRALGGNFPRHFAEILRFCFAENSVNRNLLDLIGGYEDPRLNGVVSILNEHFSVLQGVLNNLQQLSSEVSNSQHNSIINSCHAEITTRILEKQSSVSREVNKLNEHMKETQNEIAVATSLPVFSPKFGLDMLRDDDGNSLHHEGWSAVTKILNIPGVSVRLQRRELYSRIHQWEFIGPGDVRIWTCADIVKAGGELKLQSFANSCTKYDQHTDNCVHKVNGVARLGCIKHSGKVLTTMSIMPMINHIRCESLAHSKTVGFDFDTGFFVRVLNNGFCYVNCFLMMLQFVPTRQVDLFLNKLVPNAVQILGAWPTFDTLTLEISKICLSIPHVCEAPVPTLIVDHNNSVMHFVGQFGLGDHGYHQLNLLTFQDWFDLSSLVHTTTLANYRVGGLIKSVFEAIGDKEKFYELMLYQPDILVEGLLSPSVIHTLYIAEQKHGLLTQASLKEESVVGLIARINTLGEIYPLYLQVDEVMEIFFRENFTLEEPIREAFGEVASTAFRRGLDAMLQQKMDKLAMDKLERVFDKKIDYIDVEKDMRVLMFTYLREQLSFVDYCQIRFKCWYGRFAGNIKPSIDLSCAVSAKHKVETAVKTVGTAFKERLQSAQGKLSVWVVAKTCQSVMPYYAMITILIFIATIGLRMVKFVRLLCGAPEPSDVVFQNKKTVGKVPAQFMAIVAIITALFNTDWSDQWYSCMIKFKSLMSTLFEDYVTFEMDETLQGETSPVKFIEFLLKEEEPAQMASRLTQFKDWVRAREQVNQLGIIPNTQGVLLQLNKKNISSVANKIFDSQQDEFLVVGKVGCGKSTHFMKSLVANGRVLLCEPTRALVSNVEEGLSVVCGLDPTVRMRFYNKSGMHPITVMTYGFALNWFANGCQDINEFDFVCFDECHMVDANMIVFYNWMRQREGTRKLIKLSATPPGHITKYEPDCPVDVVELPTATPKTFAEQQKTSTALDVTGKGRVVLVFVASYSEVDCVSDILRRKGFGVVKADGRSLRNTPKLSKTIEEATQENVFVVATNAIENGVTLNVDVVVDFGEKIVGKLDSTQRHIGTRRVKISLGERIQRLGRVGRFKPGYALKIGTPEVHTHEIDTLTATEAALKSFAHNVNPCMINVDFDLIANVTRDQIKTASQFELDAVFLVHFVRPDGKIPKSVFNEFKHLLLRDVSIGITEKYSTNIASMGWHTLSRYQAAGYIDDVFNQHIPIPFHSYTISRDSYLKIASAVKEADPGRGATLQLPSDSLTQAAFKINYEENKVASVLAVVEGLREREQIKLEELRTSCSLFSSQSLLNILNARFLVNKGRLEKQYETNLATLSSVEQTLRSMPTGSSDGDLIEFLRLNPLAAQSVLFEGNVSGQIETQILGKKAFVFGRVLIPCLLALTGISIFYVYTKLSRRAESVKFEGSGKMAKHRRGKNGQLQFMCDSEQEYGQTFGTAYDTRKSKSKGRRKTVNPLGQKQHAFKSVYDFDLDAFDVVAMVDPETKMRAVFDMTKEGRDLSNFREYLDGTITEKFTGDWGDYESKSVHAYFFKKGSTLGYFVNLTPHDSRMVSKKNSNLPMGFPSNHGQLRQTGPAVLVNTDEMKEMGFEDIEEYVGPDVRDAANGVSFESAAMVRAARSYDHFKHYTVVADNGIGKLCGFGFGRFLCTNAHFHGKQEDSLLKKSLVIWSCFGEQNFGKATEHKFSQVQGVDIAVMKLPFDAPSFRKKLYLREPKNGEEVIMITPSRTHEGISLKHSQPSIIVNSGDSGTFWRHYISTTKGSCGSLLVSIEDDHVVGIHSLGLQTKFGWNYFTPVTKELINILASTEIEAEQSIFDDKLIEWGKLTLRQESVIFPIARMVKELVSFQNDTRGDKFLGNNLIKVGTLDRPTNFHHTIKGYRKEFLKFIVNDGRHSWVMDKLNSRLPSVLSMEAFYQDLLKYDQPIQVGLADIESDKKAYNATMNYLVRAGFQVGGLFYEWDANRIAQDMNKDAAMGACYHGKKGDWIKMIGEDGLEEAHKESLWRIYNNRVGIWTGSLKAELRPKAKVQANKTRVFTAAPVDVLLGAKTLVDEFNHLFYSTNLQGPWTVGINKFNLGWDKLARSFNHNWVFIDADGSQFDSSLSPYLFSQVCKLRLHFMEPDNLGEECLKKLYTQIVYTPISTIDGNVVKKFKGNCSGQPSTVVDNTLMLIYVVEYARACVLKETGVELEFTFVANGDDLLINTPPEQVELIRDNFPKLFSHYGLKYDFSNCHPTIETVEYMSNHFVKREDAYIPKLCKERIISILEWERSDDIVAQISALNAARIEAWGYDDVYRLADEFLLFYAKEKQLAEFFYIPEEFIAKLYMSNRTEMADFVNEAVYHVDFEMDRGRPTEATVEGIEGPTQGETEAQRNAREARNRNRVDAAVAAWERDQKAANDPPRQQDEDVPAGAAGPARMPLPRPAARTIWVPPALRQRINAQVVGQLLRYNPDPMLMRADVAHQETVTNWMTGIERDLGISQAETTTVIQSFMVWAINSGTSKEALSQDIWQADDGEGNVQTYPLKPFIQNAGVSLRSVMRNFSQVAEEWIKERNRFGTWIPAWAQRAGLTNKQYAHVGFDFWVSHPSTTHAELHHHSLMTQAHLQGIPNQNLAMAGVVRNGDEGVPDYHVGNDVAPGRHNVRGAALH
ncbi:polyprotein [Phellodendron yellow ringspot associated virus]|nr:polyprotein [Phellodendron yellow ringspot associated virus]